MTPEQYKKHIVEMLEELSLRDLSQVYTIVHRKFIRRRLEAYERKNHGIVHREGGAGRNPSPALAADNVLEDIQE